HYSILSLYQCFSHLMPFFLSATSTHENYTLSLHDALPIWSGGSGGAAGSHRDAPLVPVPASVQGRRAGEDPEDARGRPARVLLRSEEHTSELQSRENLVCRLLLEKKKIEKQKNKENTHYEA